MNISMISTPRLAGDDDDYLQRALASTGTKGWGLTLVTSRDCHLSELPVDVLIILVAGLIVFVIAYSVRAVVRLVRGRPAPEGPVGPGPLRDPSMPEEQFVSAGQWWSVEVWPALFPPGFFRDSDGIAIPFYIFFGFPLMGITWLFDRRMKVCVYRGRWRGPWMRMVYVEFLNNFERAGKRQMQILEGWCADNFADLPPLSPLVVRRLRRKSRKI